jgi:hypothetical protein
MEEVKEVISVPNAPQHNWAVGKKGKRRRIQGHRKGSKALGTGNIGGLDAEGILGVRLAWLKRPKIVCSPSYVDIRSRANTTRGLDFDHMIKARAHKGGVRIGKTPKKLASICCP